ncbi:type II secretion system F family protein [uncultured Thiohalocapsa sp.]|uniref:type II secretion system F family protein n=1 Tax=uncultured Thiohalocapsa sp. TaxID=768990 RepID=UPI0025D64509|nr:type II secretion system F family protein [uncultured Thiohalocapsa sp.]
METLTTLVDWLGGLFAEAEQLQLGYAVLVGAAVFVMTIGVGMLLLGLRDPLRHRIDATKQDASGRHLSTTRQLGRVIQRLGVLGAPQKAAGRRRTEARLRHAGFRTEQAPRLFYGLKLTALVLLPVLLFGATMVSPRLSAAEFFQFLPFAAAIGLFLPDVVLAYLARRRRERLRKGLPDAMDLLVVCSEAGLGLTAAIQRVARELEVSHPELADELELFSLQTRAGMESRTALKDLADRTGLDDMEVLVAMLLQSMRFGTSIAATLRICSDDLRDKRLQRAQEKAARISTWIIFPLVFCIMPSFLLVTMGPAIFRAINALSGTTLS